MTKNKKNPLSTGKKYDEEKLRYDLIPPRVETLIAAAMTYGAEIYGDRNWEGLVEGVPDDIANANRGRLYAALRRHLRAWVDGGYSHDTIDPTSGLPHLAHALACLAMIASSACEWGVDELPLVLARAREVRAARERGDR